MSKRYALVHSYTDRSGVLRVVGPYPSEEEAIEALPDVEDLLRDGFGVWDVVPIHDLKGVFE